MRLDHLLSKDKETCTFVLFSFERSCGALAQLGERLLCTQEVSGSIPLVSTILDYLLDSLLKISAIFNS